MNDRELIELAAKAAGYECKWNPDDPFHLRSMHIAPNWQAWNPLDDDGDALRLAVELKMSVTVFDDAVGIGINPGFGYREYDISPDQNNSTRRAIVRAAAEIGKAMK